MVQYYIYLTYEMKFIIFWNPCNEILISWVSQIDIIFPPHPTLLDKRDFVFAGISVLPETICI